MNAPILRFKVAGSDGVPVRKGFSAMAKDPEKVKVQAPEDEPGAEDRFLSGVRKALETPHKPHKTTGTKKKAAKK